MLRRYCPGIAIFHRTGVANIPTHQIDKELLRRAEAASVSRAPPKKLKEGADMAVDAKGGEGNFVVPAKPEIQRFADC